MPCNNSTCLFRFSESGNDGNPVEKQCMVNDAAHPVSYDKGEILFLQGQPSENLYSLSSGMVKICCDTPGGREQIIGLSHPGALLVGLQSIAQERYAYSATAATAVSGCRINHDRLLTKVRKNGEVAMILISALNAQLAHSRALMEVMGQKSAAAKIASLILLMVPKSHHGAERFDLPFSRNEIASLLNLTEETVCRRIASMKRKGIIRAPRGFVTILDWDQLRAMTDGAGTGCGQAGHQ